MDKFNRYTFRDSDGTYFVSKTDCYAKDDYYTGDRLPNVAPCQLCVGLIHGKSTKDCESRGLCKDCRRKFWLAEVE